MNVLVWNFSKFWDPHSNVLALGVKLGRLESCIEHEDATCANARAASPSSKVALDVAINQLLLEPVRAVSPILLEVHAKEAGDDHATAIWHEARRVHIPH